MRGGRQGTEQDGARIRTLWREVLLRLSLLYFLPMVLIAVFFHMEFRSLLRESRRVHLVAIAEQGAATLDLFMSERLVNLSNVIDDQAFPAEPDQAFMRRTLDSLRQTSHAFVELAVMNEQGRILAYAGPHPDLESRSYAQETWFLELRQSPGSHIITDIYRGFRDQPHFTIAVERMDRAGYRVLRAVLSPDRMYEELVTGARDESLRNVLINGVGVYQVVDPAIGEPLGQSPFRPPREPRAGTERAVVDGGDVPYGYAWLNTSPWALVVHGDAASQASGPVEALYGNIVVLTVIFFVLGLASIWFHARTSVRRLWRAEKKQQELSGQLVQAAKLASVGELAAGIAHEINNPLAIIAEEVGLLMDLMDPELGGDLADEDLRSHLEIIHEAVFRGRDITRKLLGFVRQTEVRLEEHDVHEIIDEVAEGLLGRELELSNISIVKEYCGDAPPIVTDRNQLEQVLLNLMKNAVDAMEGHGILRVVTECTEGNLRVRVSDTGCGMPREVLERIFQPFFTTKDPGKGTGLGLSVSHGIVESLGGHMFAESEPGHGSELTIELPLSSSS